MTPPTLRAQLTQLLCWSLPLWMILIIAMLAPMLEQDAKAPEQATIQTPQGRVVLVIVDSLRPQSIDEHMPRLRAWGEQGVKMNVLTCGANVTLPCIQTLMEGRESSLVAGLHNFTGKSGSDISISAQLKAAGREHALISDFTLDTLYGSMAEISINVEDWPKPWLSRDKRSIIKAMDLLDTSPKLEFLVLHIVGTDKVAHGKRPHHPDYKAHFEQVDEALAPLLDKLGPKDHVFVTGDHGHSAQGRHTRNSLVMIHSPLVEPLFAQGVPSPVLEQHEVTYLLWFALGLPGYSAYEGRYFGIETPATWTDPQATSYAQEFRQTQVAQLTAQGFEGPGIQTQIKNKHDETKSASARALMRYSPLLVLYLWWVFWMMTTGLKGSMWRASLSVALASLGLMALGFALPAWGMLCLGIGLLVGMVAHLRRVTSTSHQRLMSWVLCVLMMSAAAAITAPLWHGFWHNFGHFQWKTVWFFALLIGVGVVGSLWRSGSWRAYLPEAIGSVCVLVMPMGVYFYHYGQNIMRGFWIGVAILSVVALVQRLRRGALKEHITRSWREQLGIGLTVLSAVLLLSQRGSSFKWYSPLAKTLSGVSPAVSIALYVLMGILCLILMTPVRRHLIAAATLMLLPVVYSGAVGELKWAYVAHAQIATLFAFAYGRATQQGAILRRDQALQTERDGLWWTALGLFTLWIVFSGFFIDNVDFNFTLPYLKGFERESTVAFFSSWMTFAKYTFPAWMWVFALYWMRASPQKRREHMQWVWAFFHLKCMALFIHIFVGPLGYSGKRYELSISELLFTLSVGWIILAAGLVLWISQWIFARVGQQD